jgi:hypothetical protein
MDLSPSSRKIHQVMGNIFQCFYSVCIIKSTRFLSSLQLFVSLNT